jgi:hypothetical protein
MVQRADSENADGGVAVPIRLSAIVATSTPVCRPMSVSAMANLKSCWCLRVAAAGLAFALLAHSSRGAVTRKGESSVFDGFVIAVVDERHAKNACCRWPR